MKNTKSEHTNNDLGDWAVIKPSQQREAQDQVASLVNPIKHLKN